MAKKSPKYWALSWPLCVRPWLWPSPPAGLSRARPTFCVENHAHHKFSDNHACITYDPYGPSDILVWCFSEKSGGVVSSRPRKCRYGICYRPIRRVYIIIPSHFQSCVVYAIWGAIGGARWATDKFGWLGHNTNRPTNRPICRMYLTFIACKIKIFTTSCHISGLFKSL